MIRPRKATFVYGTAESGLGAFDCGPADSLNERGVRIRRVGTAS